MVFAFVCHIASAIMTIMATGYWTLYWAMFIVALGNGTVEAVINPVVATLFPREKTKWLNILHAGWPGGLVLAACWPCLWAKRRWQPEGRPDPDPGGALRLADARPQVPGPRAGGGGRVVQGDAPRVRDGELLHCEHPHFRRARAVHSRHQPDHRYSSNRWGNVVDPFVVGAIAALPLTLLFGAFTGWALGRPIFLVLVLVMIPLATNRAGDG